MDNQAVRPTPGRHPVVERYVSSDTSLWDLAQGVPQPQPPEIRALSLLQGYLDGRTQPKEALEAVSGLDMRGADPELAILLLTRWAEVAVRLGRTSEAEALLHRARSMVSGAIHPVVAATVLSVDAAMADAKGDKPRTEEVLRDAIGLIPSDSPRRKHCLWDLAYFLAAQGRCTECREELGELEWQSSESFPQARVLAIRFINAMETGQTREASQLLPKIAANPRAAQSVSNLPIRGYQALLRLMHETTEKGDTASPQSGANDPPWVRVASLLMARDTAGALRLAREEANRTLGAIFNSGFQSFNLVRAELASGTWENAKRLVAMRQSRGNRHYLDDLFLARAELLAGNAKLAHKHFGALLNAIERYAAQGRLDFELRLACELTPGSLILLSKMAGSAAAPATTGKRGQEATPSAADGRQDAASPQTGTVEIIGRSRAVARIKDAIARFADLDAPVLITGETGTGKELVARALHGAGKNRSEPFLAINCGTIHESLLESELFGHERGAFTGAERTTKGLFEDAGKGVLFLDEIGDIPARLQSALLRVLETREIRAVGSSRPRMVHCRVVAATNADLETMSKDGRFRPDLFFRLQRLGIHVPPLRERRDDILLLARHFLDLGRPIGVHAHVSKALSEALTEYSWPGNVRELRNAIERMRLLHSDKLSYEVEDLDLKFEPVNAPERQEEGAPPEQAPRDESAAPAWTQRGPRGTEGVQDSASTASARTNVPDRSAAPALPPDADAILLASRCQIRRMDQIRELFKRYKKLTRGEVIKILGVSPNTATKDMKALCDEGLIERIEPSGSSRSYYFALRETPDTSGSAPRQVARK